MSCVKNPVPAGFFVFDTTVFPGFRPSHLGKILIDIKDIDGVVLETYGAGNAPNNQAFLDTNRRHPTRKKTIVNRTQCVEGMVEMGHYEASAGLLERGVISGLDMTREAALTKLMWTMGNSNAHEITSSFMIGQGGRC